MEKQFKSIEISNFKSIKQLELHPKKVNVFIGKPNVGKSNLLEALSLFSARYDLNNQRYLSSLIRYEEFSNMFYDSDLLNQIVINSNIAYLKIHYYANQINSYDLVIAPWEIPSNLFEKRDLNSVQNQFQKIINSRLLTNSYPIEPLRVNINPQGGAGIINTEPLSHVKRYDFKKDVAYNRSNFPLFLAPPNGSNLFRMVQSNREYHKELASYFSPYDLKFVLKMKEEAFEIQKDIDGIVNSYPYSSTADTLQRIIFYSMAITTNKESVLIFEEPETHAFPPYTRLLAEKISTDETNQFFVSTHSPYLLETLIEETAFENINVYITYFEDYQTKVKELTQEDLRSVLDDSIDVFFNLDRFLM